MTESDRPAAARAAAVHGRGDGRGRHIGIAHLSLLDLAPADLVRTAAGAGYDFVGIRVRGATPAERIEDLAPGSPDSVATVAALDETGLEVVDIEFLSVGPDTGPDEWRPMLEAGAALGARTLSLAGADPDEARLVDTLGRLATDAAAYGIVPTLEPISYNAVSGVAQAARIAAAAGAAVLVDPLHVVRGGSSLDEVAALDPTLVPVLQLCDGPAAAPSTITVDGPMPRGMTADGEPRKVESRALRLPPGTDAFPLAALLRAVPDGVPVSIEVPNAPLLRQLGAEGYAAHLLESARALIAAIDAGADTDADVPGVRP